MWEGLGGPLPRQQHNHPTSVFENIIGRSPASSPLKEDIHSVSSSHDTAVISPVTLILGRIATPQKRSVNRVSMLTSMTAMTPKTPG